MYDMVLRRNFDKIKIHERSRESPGAAALLRDFWSALRHLHRETASLPADCSRYTFIPIRKTFVVILILETICSGLRPSLGLRSCPLHRPFPSSPVHPTPCGTVFIGGMLGPSALTWSFLSGRILCTRCGTVLGEGMSRPFPVIGAQTFAIASKIPLKTSSMQDVWHCHS